MKYVVAIMLIGFLPAGCLAPRAKSLGDTLKSAEDERRLWQWVETEQETLNNSGFLYHEPELEAYLNHIAKKLLSHSIAPDFRIRIKVLKDPNLNALAYPNGVIYIHSGILARINNEAQLAALLSHEITHCTHRHSINVIRSIRDRPAFVAAVQDTLAKISAVHAIARLLGATGSMVALNGYTRQLESEADRVGLDLMAKANYDPKEALNLLEHLRQEIEAEGIEEPFWLGSHPNIQQRIKNVENWLALNYGENQSWVKNSTEFQVRLHPVVLTNARLDLQRGRFEVARRTTAKYLQMQPDDARAYYLFGEILRQRNRQNDAKIAVTYYEKAILLDPSYPEPLKAIGLIYFKGGQKQLAKKFFESCLMLSPNASDKAYIQGYLDDCQLKGDDS